MPLRMNIPIGLNYLDKLPVHNFHLKLYFTPLKMKIPIPLNYTGQEMIEMSPHEIARIYEKRINWANTCKLLTILFPVCLIVIIIISLIIDSFLQNPVAGILSLIFPYALISCIVLTTISYLLTFVFLRCPVCGYVNIDVRYVSNRKISYIDITAREFLSICPRCETPVRHAFAGPTFCSCGNKVPGESQYCLTCGEDQWNK